MSARLLILFGSLLAACGFGQGFVNLDFESAVLSPVVVAGRTYADFSLALPGWTGYYGSTPATYANFNVASAGLSTLGVFNQITLSGTPITNFTAMLQGGTPPNEVDVALAQSGLVPDGTLSLHYQAYSTLAIHPVTLTLNGQVLTPIVLHDFGFYREYGVNISSFAGQLAELRFTQGHGANANNFFFDNISFSPEPVPEPGTWALLALGGAAGWLGLRRRKA